MKVKASIRRRCTSCKIIKRKGVLRVICSANPRHKQRQGPGSFSSAQRKK